MTSRKTNLTTSDLDAEHLSKFRRQISQNEVATACALHYCVLHAISPPDWLVEEAATGMIKLLKRERPSGRGRAGSQLARFQHEYWDVQRWEKVQDVRGIRLEAKRDDKILKAQPNREPGDNWRRFQSARTAWLKLETFERAAKLLVGQSAHASSSAVRASYRKVEKAICNGKTIMGLWFDDGFLLKLGIIKCLPKDLVQKGLFF